MRTASHRQPPLRLLRLWEWTAALSLPSVSLALHTPTARRHLTLAVSMLRLGARGAQRMRTASHRQPPLRLLRLLEWTAALSLPSVSLALHTPTARRHLTLAVSMLRLGARGAQRMRTASHRQPPLRLLRLWEWTAALRFPSVSLALHTPTARRHLTLAVSMLRLGARGAQRMRTASHRQPPLRLLRLWEWTAALSLPSVSLVLHTPTARRHLTLAVSMLRLGARGAQRMRTASHRQPPLRRLRLWEWTAALSLPSVSLALHTPTARRHLTLAVSMLRLGARGAQRMRTASHRQPPLRLLHLWEWTAALSLPSVSLALHTPTARQRLTLAVSMLRLGARGAQRMRTASHRQPPLRLLRLWEWTAALSLPSVSIALHTPTARQHLTLAVSMLRLGARGAQRMRTASHRQPPLRLLRLWEWTAALSLPSAAYAYCTTAPDAGCLDAPTGCEGCTAYAHCLSPPASPPPLASVGVDCSAQPSICFSCAAYAYCTTAPAAGCLDAPSGCEGCTAYAHCLSPPASPPPFASVGVDCSAQPSICFSCAAYAYCTTAPAAGCLDAPTGCEGCTAYAHCLSPPASPPPLASVGVDCSAQPSICFSCAAYAYCTTAPDAGCLDAPIGCEGCTAYAHCLSPPASPPPLASVGVDCSAQPFICCIRLLHDST